MQKAAGQVELHSLLHIPRLSSRLYKVSHPQGCHSPQPAARTRTQHLTADRSSNTGGHGCRLGGISDACFLPSDHEGDFVAGRNMSSAAVPRSESFLAKEPGSEPDHPSTRVRLGHARGGGREGAARRSSRNPRGIHLQSSRRCAKTGGGLWRRDRRRIHYFRDFMACDSGDDPDAVDDRALVLQPGKSPQGPASTQRRTDPTHSSGERWKFPRGRPGTPVIAGHRRAVIWPARP